MSRKNYYIIALVAVILGVGGYFLFSQYGKYHFENQEIILNDCPEEDCAEVSVNYMLCKSSKDFAKVFNDTIQRQLVKILTAKDTIMGVKEAGELFLAQYKADKQQFDAVAPYHIQIVDTILLEHESLISIERSVFEDFGGIHPFSWVKYINFDTTSGNPIPSIKLFKDRNKILDIAEQYFRSTFHLSEDQDFDESGFMFQNNIFSLPENIGFDQNDLILLYNPYEIAPYSAGILEVRIPLSEVNPWLSFNLNDPKRK